MNELNDVLITQFAAAFELPCDYVIDEFVIDGVFKPVLPQDLQRINNDQPK